MSKINYTKESNRKPRKAKLPGLAYKQKLEEAYYASSLEYLKKHPERDPNYKAKWVFYMDL